MHQTFYIDIDEEITSVVERLRHARASEIILVVPKRALLIQSIVNLRILKREADEAKLQLMMVTQDKLGKILIEKAGIFVQQKMDNISDEEISASEESSPVKEYAAEEERIKIDRNRLDKIGSDSFFDEEMVEENIKAEQTKLKMEKIATDKQKPVKEALINKELVLVNGKDTGKVIIIKPVFDMQPAVKVAKNPIAAAAATTVINSFGREDKEAFAPDSETSLNLSFQTKANPNFNANLASNSRLRSNPNLNPNPNPNPIPNLNPNPSPEFGLNFQDKKIEDFFYQPTVTARQTQKVSDKDEQKNKNSESYDLPVRVHKWFWAFGVITFLLVVGIATYLFVPKAMVVVSVKLDSQSIDDQIIGKTGIALSDLGNGTILATAVSAKQSVSENYTASGSKSVTNQKAHGIITIYNEYSASPQLLVATTRFMTSDGKLFRLVSGVTVPGTTTVSGQMKSGEVQAEIAADSSGDSYNVGPTTFNIPGFKSSGTKYAKIYAKSMVVMTGGGVGSAQAKVITADDIATAKNKILTELNDKLKEALKTSTGGDATILDGAMNEDTVTYSVSNAVGDVADSFQVTASAAAKALAVSQKDLTGAIANKLAAANSGKTVAPDSVITNFSRSDADLTNGMLNIKFHATAKVEPTFTADTIKKAILGKNEEQIKVYLNSLPNIQKVELNYWPSFISGRVPFISSRVIVTLDAAQEV